MDTQKHILIIAEAGVNHNGDFDTALRLVDAAVEAGVDYVKFQTFKSEKLTAKSAPKANYQKVTTDAEESQQDMLKKLELSQDMFVRLKNYCNERGIGFMSTPFELESLDFLLELGVDSIKLSSGDITNYPLLRAIGNSGLPVIISTGMCDLSEVKEAVDVLKNNGSKDIAILHCNTQYPTPFEDVNLAAMNTLRDTFGGVIGYSDHTEGIEVPIAAVAMGAEVIEKHFTLDKNMVGPDHKASLNPDELKAMVRGIRNIEKAIGTGIKEPSSSERENIAIARKSIVAACDIKAGEEFTEENLTSKRPGAGISPMRWQELIGKKALSDYCADELINITELENE